MKKSYNILCRFILILLLGLLCNILQPPSITYADERIDSKNSNKNKISENSKQALKNEVSQGNPFVGSVNFYRKYLSSIFGGHCSLEPSCSMYSLQALGEDGILLGILMTYDRLIHETDEYKSSYKILIKDEVKFFDPVKNNDFWFKKRKDEPIRRLVFNLEHID